MTTAFLPENLLDPRIAQWRQVGLSLLKASEAQIARGMELHAAVPVVESYGFSAFARPDVDMLIDVAAKNPANHAYRDRFTASAMTRMATDSAEGELYAQAWAASGVTCVLRNSGEEGNSPARLLRRLAYNTFVMDNMPGLMRRATCEADIVAAHQVGEHAFCLTTNGVPLPNDIREVNHAIEEIALFRQLGVRMMHMTYNRRNLIGDGCMELTDGGLSDFGQAVVAEMNRLGVLPDVAHSSQRTAIDTARCSTRPMVASHTGSFTLNPHRRNKTDEAIKAIADSGGVIGVCAIPRFLGGTGDINAMLDHVQAITRLVGARHVAIGTDVSYRPAMSPEMEARIPHLKQLAQFESLWQPGHTANDAPDFGPQAAQSLAWTNWPLFTVGLVQRGFTDDEITGILGGNMLRMLREA